MPSVPRELAEHRLHVDPAAQPVRERVRRSAAHKRKAIGEEVAKLLAANFIREVDHSEWVANVVMVPKKDMSLVCASTSSISIRSARKTIFRSPHRSNCRLDYGLRAFVIS